MLNVGFLMSRLIYLLIFLFMTLDEKSNLQIPSNLLQRFGTAAVCIVLLIFISGLYDFTLHLQIRKYDGLTYCGRIAKIITTAF